MTLTIATCQFPVDRDIRRNTKYCLTQMRQAADRGAHVAHFSECCLSGYAGVEFSSFRGFDWELLENCTQQVFYLARTLRLWVIVGSAHRLSGRHKPHNCLYIINDRGRMVDRYDKMFCTGPRKGVSGDLKHYSPGHHLPVFTINGVRCGTQICHDFRYPELYREYSKRKVKLVFHAYHNGHMSDRRRRVARAEVGRAHIARNHADNVWGITVPPTMQAYAASNHLWISANNTSARHSAWPSFVVRPDGVITGRLHLNRAGVLLTTIDNNSKYYDASKDWRARAVNGVHHSGELVNDRRSDNRKML